MILIQNRIGRRTQNAAYGVAGILGYRDKNSDGWNGKLLRNRQLSRGGLRRDALSGNLHGSEHKSFMLEPHTNYATFS